MGDPTGEADKGTLRLDFDRRLLLEFRGSTITSDAGLLAYRELDDTLGLTDTGANALADARTGKNGRHRLAGLLRQSVFGRLAGYEDVNDAERCVGSSATARSPGLPPQPARWGASRQSG
jgi:Transposase DDE domain group 1